MEKSPRPGVFDPKLFGSRSTFQIDVPKMYTTRRTSFRRGGDPRPRSSTRTTRIPGNYVPITNLFFANINEFLHMCINPKPPCWPLLQSSKILFGMMPWFEYVLCCNLEHHHSHLQITKTKKIHTSIFTNTSKRTPLQANMVMQSIVYGHNIHSIAFINNYSSTSMHRNYTVYTPRNNKKSEKDEEKK